MEEDVPRASGALIAKERAILEGLVGADVVTRALKTVPPDQREQYETITAMTKIPTDVVETVYYAVADEADRDVFKLHREIVRGAVEDAMRSIWRVLLRFTSDSALVRRTPLFFSKGLSRGKLESRLLEPGRAEVRLTGWADVSDMQINGIGAAVEAIMSCAGRSVVRVESDRTLDGAVLLVSWRL